MNYYMGSGLSGMGSFGMFNLMFTMTIFSAVLVHRYVCCKCGYREEWIDK